MDNFLTDYKTNKNGGQMQNDAKDYAAAERAYNEWAADGKKTYSIDEVFNPAASE